MPKAIHRINSFLVLFGISPVRLFLSLRGLSVYITNYYNFRKLSRRTTNSPLPFGKMFPCLSDRYEESGQGRGHYFYQDLLVARRIFKNRPERHIDVASRVDGLVAHVASFRSIEVVDIRPLKSNIENVKFVQIDMMKDIASEYLECADSISCLHALEHFGLGRYGDPLNPDGHLIGLRNLHAMLKENGVLYLSVPTGPSRIEFDAHRVFSINDALLLFRPYFEVISFSFVDDMGDLHDSADLTSPERDTNFQCTYGCGIYELKKK